MQPTLTEIHDWFVKLGIGLPEYYCWFAGGIVQGKPKQHSDEISSVPLDDLIIDPMPICLAAAAEWLWANHPTAGLVYLGGTLSQGFADAIWSTIGRLAAQEPAS